MDKGLDIILFVLEEQSEGSVGGHPLVPAWMKLTFDVNLDVTIENR
jgi:hypothetical protein